MDEEVEVEVEVRGMEERMTPQAGFRQGGGKARRSKAGAREIGQMRDGLPESEKAAAEPVGYRVSACISCVPQTVIPIVLHWYNTMKCNTIQYKII